MLTFKERLTNLVKLGRTLRIAVMLVVHKPILGHARLDELGVPGLWWALGYKDEEEMAACAKDNSFSLTNQDDFTKFNVKFESWGKGNRQRLVFIGPESKTNDSNLNVTNHLGHLTEIKAVNNLTFDEALRPRVMVTWVRDPLLLLAQHERREFAGYDFAAPFGKCAVLIKNGSPFFSWRHIFDLCGESPSSIKTSYEPIVLASSYFNRIVRGLERKDDDLIEISVSDDKGLNSWISAEVTEFLLRKYGSLELLVGFSAYVREGLWSSGSGTSDNNSFSTNPTGSSKKRRKSSQQRNDISASGNNAPQMIIDREEADDLMKEQPQTTPADPNHVIPAGRRSARALTQSLPSSRPTQQVRQTPRLLDLERRIKLILDDRDGSNVLSRLLLVHPSAEKILLLYRQQLHYRSLPKKRLFMHGLIMHFGMSNEEMKMMCKMSSKFNALYSFTGDPEEQFFPTLNRKDELQRLPGAMSGIPEELTDSEKRLVQCAKDPGKVFPVKSAKIVKGEDGETFCCVKLELKPVLIEFFRDPTRLRLILTQCGEEVPFLFNFDHGMMTKSFVKNVDRGDTHATIAFPGLGSINHCYRNWLCVGLASSKDSHSCWKASDFHDIVTALENICLDVNVPDDLGGGTRRLSFKLLAFPCDYPALQAILGSASFGSKFGNIDLLHSSVPRSTHLIKSGTILPTFYTPMNITTERLRELDSEDRKQIGYTGAPPPSLDLWTATHGAMHSIANMFGQIHGALADTLEAIAGKSAIKLLEEEIHAKLVEGGIGLNMRLVWGKFNNRIKIGQQGGYTALHVFDFYTNYVHTLLDVIKKATTNKSGPKPLLNTRLSTPDILNVVRLLLRLFNEATSILHNENIEECKNLARGAPIACLLFSSLYTEFFGYQNPSFRQYFCHGMWKAIDLIFDHGLTPRACGEEGAENGVSRRSKIEKRLAALLSWRGKSRDDGEIMFLGAVLQSMQIASSINPLAFPVHNGVLVDIKGAQKRSRVQRIPPFEARVLPQPRDITSVACWGETSDAAIAEIRAGIASEGADVIQDVTESVTKIIIGSVVVDLSQKDEDDPPVVLKISAGQRWFRISCGPNRGFKLFSSDILGYQIANVSKKDELRLRLGSPPKKIEKRTVSRLPKKHAGNDHHLDTSAVLTLFGDKSLYESFKKFASAQHIEENNNINTREGLTTDSISAHEERIRSTSATHNNIPLLQKKSEEVALIIGQAEAIERDFYEGKSVPANVCAVCFKPMIWVATSSDRVYPVLKESPNKRHIFCNNGVSAISALNAGGGNEIYEVNEEEDDFERREGGSDEEE